MKWTELWTSSEFKWWTMNVNYSCLLVWTELWTSSWEVWTCTTLATDAAKYRHRLSRSSLMPWSRSGKRSPRTPSADKSGACPDVVSSGDLVNMLFKGEVAVQHESEVADLWGERKSGVVDGEAEVVTGFSEGFGTMMIISDLSQFRLRKLICIHDLMSVKQLVRVEWVAVIMDLVEI